MITKLLFLIACCFASIAAEASKLPFSFSAPAGPQFTDAQKQTQRDAGKTILPLVLTAFSNNMESMRIPPGDYRFGKESWGRDGVQFALEFKGLKREAAHPFTIDATGATFWFDLPDDQAPHAHFALGFNNGLIASNCFEKTSVSPIELKRCSNIRTE